MGFWNFLGGFAIFNALCDLLSGHRGHNDPFTSHEYHDYDDYDDYDDLDDF